MLYVSITIVKSDQACFICHKCYMMEHHDNVQKMEPDGVAMETFDHQKYLSPWQCQQTWFGCHCNNIGQHALVTKVIMSRSSIICNSWWRGLFVGRVGKVGQEGGTKAIENLLHKVIRMFRVWWNVLLESFRFFLHALLYLENFSRFTVILEYSEQQGYGLG
jgi:hypothetical protein